MTDRLIKLEWQGTIAIISLNRPERHNALIPKLLSDLLAVLEDQNCLDARVVVLRAEGQSFSTGGDLLGFIIKLPPQVWITHHPVESIRKPSIYDRLCSVLRTHDL